MINNVKNLLQGIVGKEGYDQLEKAVSSYSNPEDFMKVIVVPRAILSWVAQSVQPLKKGEAGAAPMPGSESLRTRFTRHENHVDIDIIAPTGRSIYQFKEEPIVPFFAAEYKEVVQVPKIVAGLIGLNNIHVGDSEHVAGLAKSADFKQLTSIVGKLIDALVAKKLTADGVDSVVSNLGKNIKEKTEPGEEVKIVENKRVDKVMAEQDKANLKEAITHKQMEGTSGYTVPHIKAKKVEAGAAAVTGQVKKENPIKKEEIAPKVPQQSRMDERMKDPQTGTPKRGLRSLLMRPINAAIQGMGMVGAAHAAVKFPQAGVDSAQTNHKLNVQDMKNAYQAAKNPVPQPKPAPVQVVQQAAAPVKKDAKSETLKKPYESQAQAGFFHTNPEKVGGAAVVKEWDRATKGKHLPKRVEKGDGCGIVAMAEDKVAKDDSIAAGIAAAGAANGGGQGNADLTRYGKAELTPEEIKNIKARKEKRDIGNAANRATSIVNSTQIIPKPASPPVKPAIKKDDPNPNNPSSMGVPAGVLGAMNIGATNSKKAEPTHDNAPGFDFDSKKMDKCNKCEGGKIYKNGDPKTEEHTICSHCKGQGHMKKDESGTSGGSGSTPGLALAEMPGGAGIPKPGAGAQMPKPAVKPSNNPMGAAAKQSMQSGMGKPAGPKLPGMKMKVPGASLKPPTASMKPTSMAGAPKAPMMGKDEKNPDMKADAKLGEGVEDMVERHFQQNKEAERKEGHELSAKSEYFRGKLNRSRSGIHEQMPGHPQGTSVVGHHVRGTKANPPEKWTPVVPIKQQHEDHLKQIKNYPKPNLPKAEYPADGTEKSEKFYSVSTDEIFTNCEHCGKAEFVTGSNGSPVFSPCACFRVMRKDENDKPYKFVAISKKEDGSFALKFNPSADPEAIRAFLLTLKSRLLINKKFGV